MAGPTRSINYMASPNVRAFLKLIRYAETKCEDDRAYYKLYGGGTFTDTNTHPLPKDKAPRDQRGKLHTPAGAYQIIYDTWVALKDIGVCIDFSPSSQDSCAVRLIQDCHALQMVYDGQIEKAIPKLTRQWSSLPGGTQQQMDMKTALNKFKQYVKEYNKR